MPEPGQSVLEKTRENSPKATFGRFFCLLVMFVSVLGVKVIVNSQVLP
jgi:hypothetical protein